MKTATHFKANNRPPRTIQPGVPVASAARRFSKGDGVWSAEHGAGHVWQGSSRASTDQPWVCHVNFEKYAELDVRVQMEHTLIPESELVSLPGTGLTKYGQGKEGCRVGSSRYGERAAQRETISNGRTMVRRLVRNHTGDNAR